MQRLEFNSTEESAKTPNLLLFKTNPVTHVQHALLQEQTEQQITMKM